MAEVTVSEHVDAPVEEVFAYLADPANELTWMARARQREVITGDGGKGTRIRAVEQWLARRIEFVWEVTEHDPPTRYAARTVDGPFSAEFQVSLAAEGSGTTLAYAASADAGFGAFFGKLTEPLITRIFERDLTADLAELKDLLETQGGGS